MPVFKIFFKIWKSLIHSLQGAADLMHIQKKNLHQNSIISVINTFGAAHCSSIMIFATND